MGLINRKTQRLLEFAAVTTALRGNVGWHIRDILILGNLYEMFGGEHDSRVTEWLKAEAKQAGQAALVKRIEQLHREWKASQVPSTAREIAPNVV